MAGCVEKRSTSYSLRLQSSQCLPGCCHLLVKTSNNPARSIVLVQSMAQLLPGCLELLPQCEAVQHYCVPLILQGLQDSWDRGCRGGFRLHQWGAFHLYELLNTEGLFVDRINPSLSHILLYQPLLIDLP